VRIPATTHRRQATGSLRQVAFQKRAFRARFRSPFPKSGTRLRIGTGYPVGWLHTFLFRLESLPGQKLCCSPALLQCWQTDLCTVAVGCGLPRRTSPFHFSGRDLRLMDVYLARPCGTTGSATPPKDQATPALLRLPLGWPRNAAGSPSFPLTPSASPGTLPRREQDWDTSAGTSALNRAPYLADWLGFSPARPPALSKFLFASCRTARSSRSRDWQ